MRECHVAFKKAYHAARQASVRRPQPFCRPPVVYSAEQNGTGSKRLPRTISPSSANSMGGRPRELLVQIAAIRRAPAR
jgi:hypothetical protein